MTDFIIEIIKIMSPLIVSVFGAGGIVQFYLKNHTERNTNMQNLMCAIAQDRIVWLCKQACEDGEISADTKAILQEMYTPYKKNGWNNLAHVWMEEMDKLPVVD